MTSRQYQQAGERFLAQSRQELADGDPAQASEKSWGATTQMLGAAAEQRGWERHRHCHRAAGRIRGETGDGEMRRLFDSAGVRHENFNGNDMTTDEMAERHDDAEALLDQASSRPLCPLSSEIIIRRRT